MNFCASISFHLIYLDFSVVTQSIPLVGANVYQMRLAPLQRRDINYPIHVSQLYCNLNQITRRCLYLILAVRRHQYALVEFTQGVVLSVSREVDPCNSPVALLKNIEAEL